VYNRFIDNIPDGTYLCGSVEVLEWMDANVADFVVNHGTMIFAALTPNYRSMFDWMASHGHGHLLSYHELSQIVA
jgi:hypothetical protein